ncbi:MAG: glutamyl-tRNA reductase [Desulfobacterales bacterium]|nr:glutamyl-tRNA reductase [Desulfobacterales bacterium]
MDEILLIGLNHNTAPVELRECIAFSDEGTRAALENLKHQPDIKEALVISTCNRVEILLTTDNGPKAIEYVKGYISSFQSVPVADFENALYVYCGQDAVRHVFRVASSLDSMVVGEPQILGQIKEAYRVATQQKAAGIILNRMLHRAFVVAKRVRSETGIGDHAVSISYAAIELGRKIFGVLEGKKVLLVGAGEMAELAVEHLIRNKALDITVANRTFQRGIELAQKYKGRAIQFEEITEHLKFADIIISSTGSPDFVIFRDQVKNVMHTRRNRPIFFIDIAVPRDIDPEINRLSNAYVYDIDDLKGVINENIEDRKKEAKKGDRIINEAVVRFQQWYESLDVVSTIIALRNKMEAIAQAEFKKTIQSLGHLSEDDRRAIDRMTNAMLNKILHDPMLFLKQNGVHAAGKSVYIDYTRKLFNLDEDI